MGKNLGSCSWAQCYKTFLSVIYVKLFQPSLMFVGEARSLPLSGVPERCFTRVGSGLPPDIILVWKSLPGTNTSLLRKYVNYGLKSFITLAPRPNFLKLFTAVFLDVRNKLAFLSLVSHSSFPCKARAYSRLGWKGLISSNTSSLL